MKKPPSELRGLPDQRLRVLAALGHDGAKRLLPGVEALPAISPGDDRPTWEVFDWWLDDLSKLDPSAIVAAGIVVGKLLLPLCEPSAYNGDLARIVERLKDAWAVQPQGSHHEVLADMRSRIREMNGAECSLDHGSIEPPARLAARAMTHLGMEFAGVDPADGWLANAVEGLDHATGSHGAHSVARSIREGLLTLLAEPPQEPRV